MADQKCRSDGFDYKRIHKVITWRETWHMGKGHVTGRGGATKALIFVCFLGPQSRYYTGDAAPPHCSTTHRLLINKLHSPALPMNISLGNKSSPFSWVLRLGIVSLVQTEKVLTKIASGYKQRQTISCMTVTLLCRADLTFALFP